jgi:hypothetical protein
MWLRGNEAGKAASHFACSQWAGDFGPILLAPRGKVPRAMIFLPYVEGLSSVVLLFFKKHECVPSTFLGLFRPTGSYVDCDMRVTASSMFFVLMPLPWVCMKVHALLFTHAILPT